MNLHLYGKKYQLDNGADKHGKRKQRRKHGDVFFDVFVLFEKHGKPEPGIDYKPGACSAERKRAAGI